VPCPRRVTRSCGERAVEERQQCHSTVEEREHGRGERAVEEREGREGEGREGEEREHGRGERGRGERGRGGRAVVTREREGEGRLACCDAPAPSHLC